MKNDIKILRLKEVCQKVGISRSSIYSGIIAGTFPQRIKLGKRSVGWRSTDIEQWIEDRISNSQ